VKRFNILNAILLLLIALAVWRTVGVWRRVPPERPVPEEPPGRVIVDVPPVPRVPALPQLVSAIAEKDLFDQSRKAPEANAPAPAATPAPPPPTLKLAGVIFVGSQREVLLVDTAQANKQIRMREGEELGGYKIGRIQSEQISLVGPGGEETVLQMLIDKGKPPGKGFGPGGKAVAQTAAQARMGALRPPGRQPGAVAPPPVVGGIAPADPSLDARQRAESARERLKRLRAEARR
jgi:hypothetical protein